MGAEWFTHSIETDDNIKNVKDAFDFAVEEAYYDHGHMGYTGSICEKGEFIMVDDIPEKMKEGITTLNDVYDLIDYIFEFGYQGQSNEPVYDLIDYIFEFGYQGQSNEPVWPEHKWSTKVYDKVDSKWGPAGCIEFSENGRTIYTFFGWASC